MLKRWQGFFSCADFLHFSSHILCFGLTNICPDIFQMNLKLMLLLTVLLASSSRSLLFDIHNYLYILQIWVSFCIALLWPWIWNIIIIKEQELWHIFIIASIEYLENLNHKPSYSSTSVFVIFRCRFSLSIFYEGSFRSGTIFVCFQFIWYPSWIIGGPILHRIVIWYNMCQLWYDNNRSGYI